MREFDEHLVSLNSFRKQHFGCCFCELWGESHSGTLACSQFGNHNHLCSLILRLSPSNRITCSGTVLKERRDESAEGLHFYLIKPIKSMQQSWDHQKSVWALASISLSTYNVDSCPSARIKSCRSMLLFGREESPRSYRLAILFAMYT